MNRFRTIAGLALAAACLFSCERVNDEGVIPGGGSYAWRSLASGEKLAGTTYQLNVYSFADSDGDGWGDFRGVTQHLDYFDSLGVTALLLSPIFQAMSYHGYDVTDYSAINPRFGSEANFQDLVDKAKQRNIGIYLDFVLNHSGSDHVWFKQACSNPDGLYGAYYVISDTPGSYDNGGSGNWYQLPQGNGYYFATFDRSMPDFDYGPAKAAPSSNLFKDLAAAADKWIRMGVSGLRIDSANWIYQNHTDDNVALLKEWYNRCYSSYKNYGNPGDFYIVADIQTDLEEKIAPYYEGVPSIFNHFFWQTLKESIHSKQGKDFAVALKQFREQFRRQRSDFIDAILLTDHNEDRAADALDRNLENEKLAAAVLLTSPGKPYIYQGEELGYWGKTQHGKEFVRTPIKWTRTGAVASVALQGKIDHAMLSEKISVEAQEQDNASILRVYRDFAQARSAWKALAQGELECVASPDSAVAIWKMVYKDQTVLVVHNFGNDTPVLRLSGFATDKLIVSNGTVTLSEGSVTLGAFASAVFLQ